MDFFLLIPSRWTSLKFSPSAIFVRKETEESKTLFQSQFYASGGWDVSISIVDNCGVFQCIKRILFSRDLSWVDTEIVLDVALRPKFYSTIYHTYFILKLFCISKEFAVCISDSHGFNIHYLIVLINFWKHFFWFLLFLQKSFISEFFK